MLWSTSTLKDRDTMPFPHSVVSGAEAQDAATDDKDVF
jgi:hypothetical protein